jgi:hypothetical protein
MIGGFRMSGRTAIDDAVEGARGLPDDQLEGYYQAAVMWSHSAGVAVRTEHPQLPPLIITNASAVKAVAAAESYLWEGGLPQVAGYLKGWRVMHQQLFDQMKRLECQDDAGRPVLCSGELLQRSLS